MKKIKNEVKKIIGPSGIKAIKAGRQHIKHINAIICRNEGHLKTSYPFQIYEIDGKHVFFGYYDLQQLSINKSKLLAHALKINAITGYDNAEILIFSRESGQVEKVTETKAWCWQQGSRLRWVEHMPGMIMFNNFNGEHYTSEIWDPVKHMKIREFPYAFYDVTSDGKYGLSLNFDRLQRLHPGYGYSNKTDMTMQEDAPVNDGIYLYDINKGRSELIINLKHLKEACENIEKGQHYINHISVSPDNQHFIFFHIWTESAGFSWHKKLYVCDIDGKNLKCLEKKDTISHYCWKSNSKLITTTVNGKYAEYNIDSGEKKVYKNIYLSHDGHPTYIGNDVIISDTYPLRKNFQHIFTTNDIGSQFEEIAEIFSDPLMDYEYRCDTHPRISPDKSIMTIDSTFRKHKRCIILFELTQRK